MKVLNITDDWSQQVAFGRQLFLLKREYYTDQMIRQLRDTIAQSSIIERHSNLDEVLFVAIYNYWVYGASMREFIIYHFDDLSHGEKDSFITFENRNDYYSKLNNYENSIVLNNKYLCYQRLKKFYRRGVIEISSPEDIHAFLDFVAMHPVCVIKPTCMGQGAGVQKIDFSQESDLEKLFLKLLRFGKVIKGMNPWARWENVDTIVIEEFIPQAEAMEKIHPGSVNGVRLPTVVVKGEVHYMMPWLKIGVRGEPIVVERTGALMAGINLDTGIVETEGCDEFGNAYRIHPTSGVSIPGYVIPRWHEALELTHAAAIDMLSDDIAYVGWDIALTDDGWSIIEGNFDGEFMGQLPYQKGCKKKLEEIIGWKPEKDFWWE